LKKELTASNEGETVFWDIASSSAVQIDDHPDDGGRKHL
jgi:hypothetical protein